MQDGTSAATIVDSRRAGLYPSVIGALRVARGVKRIVYVSCNPKVSFVRDAVLLCSCACLGKLECEGTRFGLPVQSRLIFSHKHLVLNLSHSLKGISR